MDKLSLPFHSAPLRRLLAVTLLLAVPLQIPALVAGAQAPGVLHVDAGAAPGGDGTSWGTAFDSLQAALAQAGPGSQVWLAAGVYRPSAETSPGDPRSATFLISAGVSLYGGFAPDAGADAWEERDPSSHQTVLSGDLDADDLDPNGDGVVESWHGLQGVNAYHVVYLDGSWGQVLGRDTVLDGLTITAGMADTVEIMGQGGGIYCSGTNGECSPTLSNLLVVGNRATTGGGIYNDGGGGVNDALLRGLRLRGNYAAHDGGGMFNEGIYSGNSSPTLVDVTFEANEAGLAGGGFVSHGYQGYSNPTLLNVSFYGNRAGTWGGGMASLAYYGGTSDVTVVNGVFVGNQAVSGGGGMYNSVYGGWSSHTVINATFTANHAGSGGGLYSETQFSNHNLTLTNAVLWGNTADGAGAQAYDDNADVVISHSDIEGSGGSVAWDTALGTDGGGNIDRLPDFARQPDPGDGNWATLADNDYGDLHPGPDSPLVDAGDNAALPADDQDLDGDGDTAEPLPVDRDGGPRLVDGSGGPPAVVDTGAYEANAAALADLSLEIAISGEPVPAGGSLVYTFTIVNHGPASASQVILVDNLSPFTSFASASPGCSHADGEVTCGPGALSAGLGTGYQVTVTVAAEVPGSVVNTAHVSAAEVDPNPQDNLAEVTTQVGVTRVRIYLPLMSSTP